MKVIRVNVLDGGRGWNDEAPIVSLHGGGGTGARCIAHVDRGEVVHVEVADSGVNYVEAPEVRFSGGGRAVGVSPVAEAEIGKGGTAFADQPVPKPENPAKDPKSTPPVRADSSALEDDRKPFQPPKTKATPDEEPGRQHTESDPRKVTDPEAQFNPGGAPVPGEEKKGGQKDQPERDPSPAPTKPIPTPPKPQQPQQAPRHTPAPIQPPQPKPPQQQPQQRQNPPAG